MVNGFRRVAAVKTAASGEVVEGMAPPSGVGFRAEVFQENTIPGQHAVPSIEVIVPLLFPLAMCC
jgi:hypothetical protein